MGTEIQHKMYFPGFYSMRDLDDSTGNAGWPLHHGNKTFGQYYGIPSSRSAIDEYTGYEREHMRQTILRHENIFRHQLHELHRLHKIQMDMMNDVRSRESPKCLNHMGTSQSNPFVFSPEQDKRRWHDSSLPLEALNRHIPSSGADSVPSHLSSINMEIMGAGSASIIGASKFKDLEPLEYKCKKVQRRLFDLEMPADKYVDHEEEGQGTSGGSGLESYLSSRNHKVTCNKNGNFSIQSDLCSGWNGDALSSNMSLRRTQGFADLNKPIQVEEASGIASVDILGNITYSKEEMQRQDLSANSCSGFQKLAREVSQSPCKRKDEGIAQCSPHLNNERRQQGWLPLNHGQFYSRTLSGSFHCEHLPLESESLQVGCRKADEPDQNKPEQLKKKIFGVEISNRNQNNPVMTSDTLLQPPVPKSEVVNSESSSISSWKKLPASLKQNSILVQGNPCFNTFPASNKSSVASTHGPEVSTDRSLVNGNMEFVRSSRIDLSCKNVPCLDSLLQSQDSQVYLASLGQSSGHSNTNSAPKQVPRPSPPKNFTGSSWPVNMKSSEEVNLNAAPPKRYQDEASSVLDLNSIDVPTKEETPQAGFSWLRTIALSNQRSSVETAASYPVNLDSLRRKYSEQFVCKPETMKVPQNLIQDSSSPINVQDVEDRGDCSSSRKILGVPIFDKNLSNDQSSACFGRAYSCCASETNGGNCSKGRLLHTDLNQDPMESESVEIQNVRSSNVEKGSVDCSATLRQIIDLNVNVTEEESQSTHCSRRTNARSTVEIDLEAPVVIDDEIGVTSGDEVLESKLKEPLETISDESRGSDEGFLMAAAESLVAISSSGMHKFQDDAPCHESEAALNDSLQWFAEMISSCKGDLENEVGSVPACKNSTDSEDSVPDGVDFFEYMTLNLVETKVEKYSYEPQVLETAKEEITLPRRPRRGQARRGRQRKDFQRDVLPGLASLSRNDVTEDLHMIEGLIRATGGTWQSGMSQRNSPKSKRGRGRKRAADSAATPIVTEASLPDTEQPKCGEPGLEENRLTGWGKRTRRPPRQRYPINNPLPQQ